MIVASLMPLGLALPFAGLLTLLVRATFLLAVGLCGCLACHRMSAALRSTFLRLAILGVLALPAAEFWRAPILVRMLPAPSATQATPNTAPALAAPDGLLGMPLWVRVSASEPASSPQESSIPLARATYERARGAVRSAVIEGASSRYLWFVVGIWCFGTAVLLMMVYVDTRRVATLVRRAVPIEDEQWRAEAAELARDMGLASMPRLRASSEISVPFVVGLNSPTIVVPSESLQCTPGQRRTVLAHEITHVLRGDFLAIMLSRITCALYWIHPLAWSVARRLRYEAERAVDDRVLGSGMPRLDYAEHLLDFASVAARPRNVLLATLVHESDLRRRLASILDSTVVRTPPTRLCRRCTLTSAILIWSLTAMIGAAPVTDPMASGGSRPTADSDTPHAAAPGKGKRANKSAVRLPRIFYSDDPTVRERAAWALHGLREAGATPTLATILEHDADARVRKMAAWSLGFTGSTLARESLTRTLVRDDDEAVREMALWALGRHPSATNTAALAEALADSSRAVRALAAWTLGVSAKDRVPMALLRAVNDPDPSVRRNAAWAVEQIHRHHEPQLSNEAT